MHQNADTSAVVPAGGVALVLVITAFFGALWGITGAYSLPGGCGDRGPPLLRARPRVPFPAVRGGGRRDGTGRVALPAVAARRRRNLPARRAGGPGMRVRALGQRLTTPDNDPAPQKLTPRLRSLSAPNAYSPSEGLMKNAGSSVPEEDQSSWTFQRASPELVPGSSGSRPTSRGSSPSLRFSFFIPHPFPLRKGSRRTRLPF